ncbi:MAG: DUF4363 family protein [Oscillospiraceae bacterium]|nr:DUF4363 family protein [Oscillospiraceae bacterium]
MKRVIFAAALLAAVILLNILCIHIVADIKNDITEKLDTLYEAASEGPEEAAALCGEFTEYWIEKSHILCRIVRHDLIDQITIAVARFAPLAEYGEIGELSAEILRCKILLEEIWDSEMPFFRNIF